MCRCSNRCNNDSNNGNNNNNTCSIASVNNYNYRYGSAFVPNQSLGQVFTPMEGLNNGTMFPELVSSYYPGESLEVMNYLRPNRRGGCM